jgi:flagellar biosynthesis component FlhA
MTIIKDKALEPFHISKDQYCYTVVETITPNEKNLGRFGNKGNKNEGKVYEKPLGHYGDLSEALKKIVKAKVEIKEEYNSILEYVAEYDQQKETINKLFNQVNI